MRNWVVRSCGWELWLGLVVGTCGWKLWLEVVVGTDFLIYLMTLHVIKTSVGGIFSKSALAFHLLFIVQSFLLWRLHVPCILLSDGMSQVSRGFLQTVIMIQLPIVISC